MNKSLSSLIRFKIFAVCILQSGNLNLTVQYLQSVQFSSFKAYSAPLSDLLVNPWLNKSKRVLSSGGARTHTTRGMENFSLLLYQLSYQGLMLGEAILLRNILISIFLIIFHHYLIFLETRPSWKGQ